MGSGGCSQALRASCGGPAGTWALARQADFLGLLLHVACWDRQPGPQAPRSSDFLGSAEDRGSPPCDCWSRAVALHLRLPISLVTCPLGGHSLGGDSHSQHFLEEAVPAAQGREAPQLAGFRGRHPVTTVYVFPAVSPSSLTSSSCFSPGRCTQVTCLICSPDSQDVSTSASAHPSCR